MTMRILVLLLLCFPAGLSDEEFAAVKKDLQIKSKPWATIPWRATVTEARDAAAREKKPIFMMVDTGNPIGFA